jgi:uncharacterized protein
MTTFSPTPRTTVRRRAQRAAYDEETIFSILDEALVAHVGFVDDGQPYVLPMAFARIDRSLFLHGSTKTRMLERIAAGVPICMTVTLTDGLVLARSAFHHSMNYRSVTIIGRGHEVVDADRSLAALRALTEKLVPGRWADVREPNAQEMKATRVVEIPIAEAAAKVRRGAPVDDEEDMTLDVWAGCIPIVQRYGDAVPDPRLASDTALPDHVRALLQR